MIRPRHDRIVVEPLDDAQAGVIEVITHNRPRRGRVVAVGPGKPDKRGVARPWGTQVGNVIQFTEVCVYPEYVDEHGKRYLILQEADVCGIECEAA